MERAAGFVHDDALEAKLGKLDAVLAQTSTSKQDAALLADMLSLPNDGRYPALDLTPEQRRQRTLQGLVSQMEALARQNPILMIFEDAHWSDPTSLEVIGRVIDRIVSLRVLLLVTFRPEFAPPWIGQPQVTALTLNRLPRRDIDAMIDGVVGNKLLPASLRQDIVERTDGIPLFVEEMTKAVLEAENEGEARRTAAAIPAPALAVPASLQASLMARLDRLGSAKEVAQIEAAIGREFSHALLVAVARKPEAVLAGSLDRLTQSGLLFRQGTPPHAAYLFKHALVQDAAYGTLLRESRRVLHARIAEALQSQFAEIAESQPELLAHHYTEAGLIEKAAGLWGRAGQRSLERLALVEAVEQSTRAVDQIANLPTTPALRREQINFQVALANAIMHVKGYAAPETKTATERARLLIEQADGLGEPPEDPLLLFSVPHGFYIANLWAFNGNVLRSTAAQLLMLAEKQGTTAPLLIALRSMGLSLLLTGDLLNALAHQDRALSLYDPNSHRPLATRFGVAGSAVFSHRSSTLWCLGYPEAALGDSEQALKDARGIDHAPTLINALSFATFPHIECGKYATAFSLLDELAALTDKTGALSWKTGEMAIKGRVLVLTGKASDAIPMIESSVAARLSTGTTLFIPMYCAYLAKAYSELGQFDNAWRRLGEAMVRIEATGESWFEAEVNRIAGEIALKSPDMDTAKAEAFFERALAVARQQQAKSWELRAAMSKARVSGAIRVSRMRLASFSLRSTAGLPKGLTHAI
jgi:predicted ATPase